MSFLRMKIFKRIMLIFFSTLLILILGVIIFFRTAPQIGNQPKGERLERMQAAPNYKDGVFVNTVTTNMSMPFSTVRKVVREQFFSDRKPRSPQETINTQPFDEKRFTGISSDTLAFTWFGHSTILYRINGITILADPVLVGERASMFSFLGPKRFAYDKHINLDELPPIDVVILSHDHYDHLDYSTIKALSKSVERFYMPLGMGSHLEHWGVPGENITELNWWDEISYNGIRFILAPTRHFSGRAFTDRFKTLWGSWVIESENFNLYFSGDSGYFPGFKEIGEKYGPFDITFMECGAYNEAWSEIHMFPEETAQAHLDVRGKLLMPIHWGKFDLSLHPWKESVNRLEAKAESLDIELVTPEVGEMVLIPDSSSFDPWWKKYL